LNANELSKHLAGHDGVVSAMGAPGIHASKVTLYLDSAKALVVAMRNNNIKRLVILSSFYSKRKKPKS
jgi:hypothetical protein